MRATFGDEAIDRLLPAAEASRSSSFYDIRHSKTPTEPEITEEAKQKIAQIVYIGQLSIGTPGQRFNMILDTGIGCIGWGG
ncbi:unnamed protein product, partial [Mesorhabditis belari]|uniref:Peptidase A1 domain-containing protein n=1 Tax=Mesorhabditis belari TaxID=2138241 RepID=A0AAF3J8M9_9BILA